MIGRIFSTFGLRYGLRIAKRFFKSSKRTNQAKLNASDKSSFMAGAGLGTGYVVADSVIDVAKEGTKSFKQLAILFIVLYILANRK